MNDELASFTLGGREFVVVPRALAAAHGIGVDPAAERRRRTGERLRGAREAAGLSQTELAAKLDSTQPSVSAAERGQEGCSDERVTAWLAACGFEPDWTPPRARRRGKAER